MFECCGAGNPARSRLFRRLGGAIGGILMRGQRRLKAGGSQDWLPHR
jgi:hypothetical protein